jgi:hypothetical protein
MNNARIGLLCIADLAGDVDFLAGQADVGNPTSPNNEYGLR